MYNFSEIPKNSIGDDMENTGMTRRIDDLGRIVIPKEIRKNLKIRDSDELEINVIDNKIILNKYDSLKKDKFITCLLYTIGKKLNKNVLYTSREKIIDVYLKGKSSLSSDELSNSLIHLIENRRVIKSDLCKFTITDEPLEIAYIVSPLIINGDLVGSIILYDNQDISNEDEEIMAFSKIFLENYLE